MMTNTIKKAFHFKISQSMLMRINISSQLRLLTMRASYSRLNIKQLMLKMIGVMRSSQALIIMEQSTATRLKTC